jgi:ribosomal protein S18 acetylase RimI-like enzyme
MSIMTPITTAQSLPNKIDKQAMSSLQISDATLSDAAGIAHVGVAVFTSTFGYSMPAADLSTYLEETYSQSRINQDMANPNLHVIVARDGDKVVGFAMLMEGTSEKCVAHLEVPMELQRLYVATEYHGCGLGSKLLARVQNMARDKGAKTMWLGVWEENHIAQKVYAKAGFETIGSHDFVMGECVQTDLICWKTL